MTHVSAVELVSNRKGKSANHAVRVRNLFKKATYLDCLVAFAREKGFGEIDRPLVAALERGMCARFVIGLDYFQTEPEVLRRLLDLARIYPGRAQLFISTQRRRNVFHPKVYVFQYGEKRGSGPVKALVGSANMTGAGLNSNHEFSVYLDDSSAQVANQVGAEIEHLLVHREIEAADDALIDEYEEKRETYTTYFKLATKQAKGHLARSPIPDGLSLNILEAILFTMKNLGDFDEQTSRRKAAHAYAQVQLEHLRTKPVNTTQAFLRYYIPLLAKGWQSGNLKRRREEVAKSGRTFQTAINALHSLLKQQPRADASTVYDLLRSKLMNASHVGPNVISEILHTYDNDRFAVMNGNSADGLRKAGIEDYVQGLNKKAVDGTRYAHFCADMKRVQLGLGLANLSEVDALLNYAYWN